MTDPNVIDLRNVSGSELTAAKFDQIGRNLLNVSGMVPSGEVIRLGTLFIGFDGTLTPVWSAAGDRLLPAFPAQALLTQITARLPRMPAGQHERTG
jgi:hypothetical protein